MSACALQVSSRMDALQFCQLSARDRWAVQGHWRVKQGVRCLNMNSNALKKSHVTHGSGTFQGVKQSAGPVLDSDI